MTTAWSIYIVASVAIVLMAWYPSRTWRPLVLWRVLRVWLAALMLVPGVANNGESFLAPAWVMVFFGAANGDDVALAAGSKPLLSALFLSLAVIIVGYIVEIRRKAIN